MSEDKRNNLSILLVAFNRPNNARKVLEQIRKVKPSRFYYAIDGPRENNLEDQKNCKDCQSLLELVDWDCAVHTLFREKNVGCGFGPSQAISWAFESTDRLIVLEDDCLPSLSFFSYCEELLERYENDKRIGLISGLSIHSESNYFGKYDYLFTRFSHTWGWATWKNRWEQFDMYMRDFPMFSEEDVINSFFEKKTIRKYFMKRFSRIYNNIEEEVKHSWDSQWDYARLKNGWIDITPRLNLISNIGASDGTHNSEGAEASALKTNDFQGCLNHPLFIINNTIYDNYHFSNYIHRPIFMQLIVFLSSKKGIKQMIEIIKRKFKKS